MKICSQHPRQPTSNESQKRYSNTPSQRLKGQIDAILKNDYSVLSRHPSSDHNSLLTKHNNSLILKYVKNIYQEYNIKDPLPNWNSRVKTEPNQPEILRSSKKKKKLHLYSNSTCSPYRTPTRTEQPSPSQILKTEPAPQPFDIDPQAIDRIESQDTIKKYDNRQQTTTLKASNSYFESRSNQLSFTSPLNQNVTYIDADRFNISRNNKSGKEMRIQTEEEFSNLDQNQYQRQFQLPSTPTLPAVNLFTSNQQQSNKQTPTCVRLNIEGAQQAQSRLMMPFPLPEIVTLRGTSPLQLKQIKQTFRYCIGCQEAQLEANIQFHQKVCEQFQKVLSMEPADIIQHLKQKIRKFQGTIKKYSEQLLQADAVEIGEHSRLLLNESSNIVGGGEFTSVYQKEYGSVLQISRKWCLMSEEINKVNWFLKIRQRVRKQLQI